jgi:hypothetical protein
MTERRATEPFEAQFAGRVRSYTDAATARRIDALGVARSAMASQRAGGWSAARLGAGVLSRRFAGDRWAVAFMAVLIGVVGVALVGRRSDPGIASQPTPSASTSGVIPDALRHAWQRPLPTVPEQVLWPTAFLSLVSGQLEFGPEPGAGASRSAIAVADSDMVAVTATVETIGCAIGDVGIYRWSLTGKDTYMTLTAVGPDACAAREEALSGDWVRSDLPPPADPEATLPPGAHQTSSFNPFGDPPQSGRLSYTVAEGWQVKQDEAAVFVLHHLADAAQGQTSADTFLALFVQPRMSAVPKDGAACDRPIGEAPGVGAGVGDLVAAIVARPGVVSTAPIPVKVGGYDGQLLDLQLAASWTGGCITPEGPIGGLPIINQAGSGTGPAVGVGPDHPVRLILLDLTKGRTMAVVIFEPEPIQPSPFEAHAAEVMPIIESFEFDPLTP